MRNWDTRDESGSDYGCQWERDWEDVQKVCGLLNLPCEMVCLTNVFYILQLIVFRLIYPESTGLVSLNRL